VIVEWMMRNNDTAVPNIAAREIFGFSSMPFLHFDQQAAQYERHQEYGQSQDNIDARRVHFLYRTIIARRLTS